MIEKFQSYRKKCCNIEFFYPPIFAAVQIKLGNGLHYTIFLLESEYYLAHLCELLPSLGVRRPSVNFFKNLLL